MRVGGIADVSLKDARAAAAKYRVQVAHEVGSIKQREKDRREAIRTRADAPGWKVSLIPAPMGGDWCDVLMMQRVRGCLLT